MASSSSSTKKAAKLAQKGQGQKIRFQGGVIFPLAVAATLILGLALIVYARQSLPAADSSPPTIDDHWHAAYGFYLCDSWYQLEGDLEERNTQGQFINTNFLRTGIHSHNDGVIHWHPYTARAVGRNATLGVFLDTYEVALTNDTLTFTSEAALSANDNFPPLNFDPMQEYLESDTKCDGEDAELSVKAWGSVHRHRRWHALHRQHGRGPRRQRRDGVRDLLHRQGRRSTDATVGPEPAAARRRRHAPGPSRGPAPERNDTTVSATPPGRLHPVDSTRSTPRCRQLIHRSRADGRPHHIQRRLMFAVVLVGGFGTRLRPLTNDVPKPMLPVVHRPMIVGMVDRLAAGGVTDVVLALGFRPEPFASAFVDGRHGDVRVHYAVEPQPLDTGGAIAFAARSVGLDDTFVVANGDVITDLDVASLIGEHRRIGTAATIHLTPVVRRVGVRRGRDRPGRLRATLHREAATGADRVEPDQCRHLRHGTVRARPDRTRRARLGRARHVPAARREPAGWPGSQPTDYWIDTGRPEQFLQANLDLIRGVRGAKPDATAATANISPQAIVVESVIDDDVVVEAGATITESVLLPGARVEAGADVRNSIVAGRIGPSAAVDGCVVGAGFSVDGGAVHLGQRLPNDE